MGINPNNLRFGIFVGVFAAAFVGAAYPVIISPMLNPAPYRQRQAVYRSGINQEEIQPGNMRVWSNPFGKKTEDDD